mgnify:CR=1 FL=1
MEQLGAQDKSGDNSLLQYYVVSRYLLKLRVIGLEMEVAMWQKTLFGGMGAIAPDILILYSKRWTMPSFTFDVSQYLIATIAYVCLAAVVASIYPYGKKPTPWKAFAVGAGLPVIISGLMAMRKGEVLEPRGGGQALAGDLFDLMSLF